MTWFQPHSAAKHDNMPFTFEEKYQVVHDIIQKYSNRWRLDAIHWTNFEDISSEIETHIWKKWHLWDQSKPIEPWIATVCMNQIRNKLRNLYGNFARPCIKCPNSLGETHCSATASHEQCIECPIYKAWVDSGKKTNHDIKMALELENHAQEVNNRPSEEIDYELAIGRLRVELAQKLEPQRFVAFEMLNFEHKDDKEVAVFLGFKNRPGNTVMRQMETFKSLLFVDVKAILKESDISELLQ